MTYEYKCRACGHEWELEQKITENAVTQCPECKEEEAQRLVSGGQGFQLKGGGWASEGYK